MTAARAAGQERRLPIPVALATPLPRPAPRLVRPLAPPRLPASAWSMNGGVMQSASLLLHTETKASGLSLSV